MYFGHIYRIITNINIIESPHIFIVVIQYLSINIIILNCFLLFAFLFWCSLNPFIILYFYFQFWLCSFINFIFKKIKTSFYISMYKQCIFKYIIILNSIGKCLHHFWYVIYFIKTKINDLISYYFNLRHYLCCLCNCKMCFVTNKHKCIKIM